MFVLSLVGAVAGALPDPRLDAAEPARLQAHPDWRAFQADTGGAWRVVPDSAGALHLVGGSIPVGAFADEGAGFDRVFDVLRAWPHLLGVPPESLRPDTARYAAGSDAWYLTFGQYLGDVPVWRTGVRVQVRHGNIVSIVLHTRADLPAPVAPLLDAAAARSHLDSAEPTLRTAVADGPATLVWLPLRSGGRGALTWVLPLRQTRGVGRPVRFVDARDGRVVAGFESAAALDGEMTGACDTRPASETLRDAPMPDLTLTGSAGGETTTDADGAFSVDDTESWTGALSGPFFRVTNEAGAEGTLAIADAAPRWSTAVATQAEIDAWVFLHEVTRWAERFAPDNPLLSTQLRAKVNTDTPCNGYYDGAVNFGVADAECANYAQVADVVYHEWGHAFHEHGLLYGAVDPTLGEGIADVVAMLQTLDPQIAPGAIVDGGALRELETDLRYPEDWSEVYYVAELIYAGAAWDLFVRLQTDLGEGPAEYGTAWAISSQLLADAIRSGPDTLTVADAYLLADDDDGDLSNGTPHICAIVESFGAHGLGPGAAAFPVTLVHTPVERLDAATPTQIEGLVHSAAPGCLDVDVAAVELYTSTDGGVSWTMTPATLTGSAFTAPLPSMAAGTVLAYYVLVRSTGGVEVTVPTARWAPYTAYVGEVEELWCTSLDDDGGFQHSLADGSGGWDDWEFGAPNGKSLDPHEAWSGSAVWGTDLGADADDGAYPRAVNSSLSAPTIDVAGHDDVVLRYRRWLTVEDGAHDIAAITANGAVIWSNHASTDGTEDTVDETWMSHTVLVPLDGATTLDLAWTLQADSDEVYGGWNLDDVCVLAAPAQVDTGDTGEAHETDTAPKDNAPEDAGCGCATGVSPTASFVFLLLARRRR